MSNLSRVQSFSGLSNFVGWSFTLGSLNADTHEAPGMAMEERKGIQVSFIFLTDFDIQKAFDVGMDTASKLKANFDGFNVFTFAGNPAQNIPPRDVPTLNFFTDQGHVGEIIMTLAKELQLGGGKFAYQAFPTSRYFPRTQVSPTSV